MVAFVQTESEVTQTEMLVINIVPKLSREGDELYLSMKIDKISTANAT